MQRRRWIDGGFARSRSDIALCLSGTSAPSPVSARDRAAIPNSPPASPSLSKTLHVFGHSMCL